MKIIICGSISAADEILRVKNQLEVMGHVVEIPEGVKNEFLRGRTEVSLEEKAEDKIQNNLIRGYFEKIRLHDAVLVVNRKRKASRVILAEILLLKWHLPTF